MSRVSIFCACLVLFVVISITDAGREVRSPQRGFSQANAQASAQAGGGGFGRPGLGRLSGLGRPGGFGSFHKPRPSLFGRNQGGGGSISISKSISISRGGSAQSSANSAASGK